MTTNSISDLIYIFADGESTEAERAKLFGALASDKELQNEFHDTINIRNTSFADATTYNTPHELSDELFRKAGLATEPAPAAVSFFSLPLLQKILIPLLSFSAGLLIVAMTNTGIDESPTVAEVACMTVQLPESPAEKQGTSSIEKENNLPPKTANIISDNKKRPITNVTVAAANGQNEAVLNESAEKNNRAYNTHESADISLSHISVPDIVFQGPARYTIEPVTSLYQGPDDELITQSGDNRFAINASGIAKLLLLPERRFTSDKEYMLDNFSIGLDYMLAPGHWLGLKGGHEIFQIFVTNGNNELELNKSLPWIGLHYKYEANDYQLPFGMVPYAELTGAATVSGPMGKAGLGLIWMPDSRVKLFMGIEAAEMLYKYNQNYENTTKLSINYGLSVAF